MKKEVAVFAFIFVGITWIIEELHLPHADEVWLISGIVAAVVIYWIRPAQDEGFLKFMGPLVLLVLGGYLIVAKAPKLLSGVINYRLMGLLCLAFYVCCFWIIIAKREKLKNMRQWRKIISCLGLILGFMTPTDAQGWRGIRPLHSTREEVERIIGPPINAGGITYDLKGARVNVVYSKSICTKGWPYDWNVPISTVIGITVFPQPRPMLNNLKIDLREFKKYVDRSDFVHFNSDVEGISLSTDPDEKEVRSIEYFPPSSEAHMRCPEAADRQRRIESGESAYRAPDVSYSGTSLSDQHNRLKFFAQVLAKRPAESQVFIIGYGGKRAAKNEGQTRADLARGYLTRKCMILERRIITIDGGYRDPAGVELYIVDRGEAKPLASPNIYPGNVQIVSQRH